MRKKKEVGPIWPSWFYGPNGEKGVFEKPEDVPVGWVRKLGVPERELEVRTTTILDRDILIAELLQLGIDINHTWGNAHMKKVINDASPTG